MEEEDNMNDSQEDVLPQAMAFTVTFDAARTTTKNQFVKRHIRNLSLPISKVYDNKTGAEPHVNGNGPKNIGNHSEGYFSSDPEEDPNNSKNFPKTKSFNGEIGWSDPGREEEEEESDCGSETGTYTVEKESSEVITARLSIDANFGLQSGVAASVQTSRDSPHWIDEWASQAQAAAPVTTHQPATRRLSDEWSPQSPPVRSLSTSRPTVRPTSTPRPLSASKIPSPVVTRARLGSRGTLATPPARTKTEDTNSPLAVPKFHNNARQEERRDTERYLKATEKVVEAMTARLSFDSESEPEATVPAATPQPQLTRYNRAVSLRRGRLEENGTIKKTETKAEDPVFKKPLTPKPKTPTTPILSRTDTGRTSIRVSRHPPSPQLSTPKTISNSSGTPSSVKKKPAGARSNSTLSSKEVEFQNWKRRKSYDPMKAAAEGKKSTAKTKPTLATNSSSCPPQTTSVLRSASFHGTRQLSNPQQSSSDDEEIVNASNDEEEWPVLQAPKTSRETTPLGSRVSLYSNSSNSPRTQRHKLEGVDNLVVSAVASLSSKLRLSGSGLLRKLRCLYDDENDKSKVLEAEIELLENTDTSSPQPRSPSKELASTLRNLKRIDNMIKVLDEVLFDDTEYE